MMLSCFTLFCLLSTIICDNYISVTENVTVRLKCGNHFNHDTVKSKWLNPIGDDIISQTRFTVVVNGSLLIRNVRRSDAGQYTCSSRIKTDRGLTPKSVVMFLNVKYVPHITSIKSNIRVFQNHSVVLPCSALGNPGVTFQWLYPNKTVIKDSLKHLVLANGSLLVRNVHIPDGFTYTCAPYNGVGEGVHGHTRLHILIAPSFQGSTGKEERIVIPEGESIALYCNSTGTPQPNTTWKHLNSSSRGTGAVLELTNVKTSDAGVYVCYVRSIAGQVKRHFVLDVIGVPSVPTKFSLTTVARLAHITWEPSYSGGLVQEFELWYRPLYKSDYEWQVVVVRNTSDHAVIFHRDTTPQLWEMYHYYSLRAKNKKGFSYFTPVLKALMLNNDTLFCASVSSIAGTPLAPYNFVLNVSSDHYNMSWKYTVTPGRPVMYTFLLQYRIINSTHGWKKFEPITRSKRSIDVDDEEDVVAGSAGYTMRVNIMVEEISHSSDALEFQVSSVSKNNMRSSPTKPSVIIIQDIETAGSRGSGVSIEGMIENDVGEDLIPAVVLACIFGIFISILFVSLVCFCRRKDWCRDKKERDVVQSANGCVKPLTYTEYKDGVHIQGNKLDAPQCRPQVHVKTCPSLQLGLYIPAQPPHKRNKIHSDEMFMLVEANPKEKVVCTCKKGFNTLDSRPHKKKDNTKKILYKCSSSPSILITSEADKKEAVNLLVDEDEEFEVSELEEEPLTTELIPHSQRCTFTRSQPRDHTRVVNSVFPVCSTTLETHLEPHPKDSDDILKEEDVSSEDTVPSESSETTKLATEVHRGSKSSEGKSSGFDEEIVSPNNFVNFNRISRFAPLASKSDIGYFSDASSKLSLSESIINNKCSERSKYNTIGHNFSPKAEPPRPSKPPSYTQAIVDIERMSERSERTDSEKSFDHLSEMEKQLGVQLNHSDDSDGAATTQSLMTSRFRHSIPRNYFSDVGGYSSDTLSSGWRDKYTSREKTLRCNQLLEEFKTSRKNQQQQTPSENSSIPNSPRSKSLHSVLDSIIPEEVTVKRKTSCSSSTSTFSEWLV